MPCRTRPTKPLPEPADATFTVLLQEAAQSGSRRRRAWAQLIDHFIAGERDAEQEELRGLIAYCHERVDLLNSSDADFIVSMKRIVERYAVTPRQRRWALDIVHRLLHEGSAAALHPLSLPMPIAAFGSSDCATCSSHLLQWSNRTALLLPNADLCRRL
jgi:hypothetical protein